MSCAGSSDNAAEPAAAESAAAEAPASSGEGLVQPFSVSDEFWALFMETLMESDQATSDETPEVLANLCEEKVSSDAINRNAEKLVADGEGTLEEWISILITGRRRGVLVGRVESTQVLQATARWSREFSAMHYLDSSEPSLRSC